MAISEPLCALPAFLRPPPSSVISMQETVHNNAAQLRGLSSVTLSTPADGDWDTDSDPADQAAQDAALRSSIGVHGPQAKDSDSWWGRRHLLRPQQKKETKHTGDIHRKHDPKISLLPIKHHQMQLKADNLKWREG